MEDRPFDDNAAIRARSAKRATLVRLLNAIQATLDLRDALDVGCGYGFFSRTLSDCGLKVTAIDGRESNVEEAARRNPNVEARVCDVQAPGMDLLGKFDCVLCFGLLYHLENPLAAVRNIVATTGKVLLIESVVAPSHSLSTVLYEEEQRDNQALNYIACIPTERWLIKAMYLAGMSYVYRSRVLPDHEDFHATLLKRQRRTVLVASRVPLDTSMLLPAREPRTKAYLWDTLSLAVLEREGLRNIARLGRRLVSTSVLQPGVGSNGAHAHETSRRDALE
jgi:SAM-dependent methyltransferase